MGKFQHNPFVKTYNHGEIEQIDLKITPLRSIYTFRDDCVELKVTFMTQLIANELELMSRPVPYISYEIVSVDGKEHNCSVYFDVSALLCIDKENGNITFGRDEISVYCGKGNCGDMLAVSGDDLRIDWGYLHLAAKNGKMGFTDNSSKYQIYYKRKNEDRKDLEGKTVPFEK